MAQYKSFYKLLESLADKYNDKTAVYMIHLKSAIENYLMIQ